MKVLLLDGVCPLLTKNAESVFGLHRARRAFTKHGHHVEKVLKRAVAVVARAKNFAYSISEGIHSELRILQDLRHRQLGILVVANLFGRQRFEFLVSSDPQERKMIFIKFPMRCEPIYTPLTARFLVL